MSETEYKSICHGLEDLVKCPEASMLSEQLYEDLQKICDDARSAAEKEDFKEAHRLFAFARDLLNEENNISGTE